jgi:hypothetical protein
LTHKETQLLEQVANTAIKYGVKKLISVAVDKGLDQAGLTFANTVLNNIVSNFVNNQVDSFIGLTNSKSDNPNSPVTHPFSRDGGFFEGDISATFLAGGTVTAKTTMYRDYNCNSIVSCRANV